jgi:hypothetical protein
MKKADTHEFTAEGEDNWKFNYMVFLPSKLGRGQAAIVYYDITQPGSKRYVDTQNFYTRDPDQQIISGYARLSHKKFKGDKKYLMVFKRSFKGKPLAKTKFVLRHEDAPEEDKSDEKKKEKK